MSPPVRRPIPRFIADASVEGLPYGRWAQLLREQFAKACEPHDRRGRRTAGRGHLVPRAGLGRPRLRPAVAPVEGAAQTASEHFGFVSFVRPAEGEEGEAGDFAAQADFTDVVAADNPDWLIDLNEEVIGPWRGEADRRGDVTLVWGTPMVRAPGRLPRSSTPRSSTRRP